MGNYRGIYSCGHEGSFKVFGSSKEREYRIDAELRNVCPVCRKKELLKANELSAEKSEALGLPNLKGTEGQVGWASTLRLEFIDDFNKRIEKEEIRNRRTKEGQEIKRKKAWNVIEYGLNNYTNASFWIDNRGFFEITYKTFLKAYQDNLKNFISVDVAVELKNEAESLIFRPEESSKAGIVILKEMPEGNLGVRYVKDDDFIKIMREKGFSWDSGKSVWIKKINEYSGRIDDRAAEIGNRLLLEGFTVCFFNKKQMTMAVNGIFDPECKRWVKAKKENNSFRIWWGEKNDMLYMTAKKLSAAKWERGAISVPVEFYSQVIDFAETMKFSISTGAAQLIKQQIEKEEGYLTGTVNAVKNVNLIDTDENRIKKSLKGSGTIIGDLLDET